MLATITFFVGIAVNSRIPEKRYSVAGSSELGYTEEGTVALNDRLSGDDCMVRIS